METLQVLTEIKSAEENSEKITEEAGRKREQMINDSRKFSLKLINEKKLEIQQKAQEDLKKKSAEFEELKQKLIKKAKDDAERLEKLSKKEMQRAVELIVKKFEEYIEH